VMVLLLILNAVTLPPPFVTYLLQILWLLVRRHIAYAARRMLCQTRAALRHQDVLWRSWLAPDAAWRWAGAAPPKASPRVGAGLQLCSSTRLARSNIAENLFSALQSGGAGCDDCALYVLSCDLALRGTAASPVDALSTHAFADRAV